ELINLGIPGAQSGDLLSLLRDNALVRSAVRSAEIITWNIGGNDLRAARERYKAGACGGSDEQACLRAAEAALYANWDALLDELAELTAGRTVILRSMDIYNPYVADDLADGSFPIFQQYIDRANAHLRSTARSRGVRVAEVARAFNGADGMSDPVAAGLIFADGLHPNDAGHALLAEALANLAFSPLWPDAAAAFERVWQRTDAPVSGGATARTWVWGPEPFVERDEPYAESPGGLRRVRYYDKSRMEISQPDADSSSIWYVTNGLLVVEMVTGRVQLGDDVWEQRSPAQINVAGDPDDPAGPTYATFALLRDLPPVPDGSPLTQRVDRQGVVTDDPTLARFGAFAAQRVSVPGIDHQVASPFWEFMQSSGVVAVDEGLRVDLLFANPFYATGLPISEAYWATVRVAGAPHDVLIQCFERRCLTWTPDNPPGWHVEAGNVGRHYYSWRYDHNEPQRMNATLRQNRR
ncbi:MAG: hypothetical protein DCC58_17235, partial [Chloroflexi bacterium]